MKPRLLLASLLVASLSSTVPLFGASAGWAFTRDAANMEAIAHADLPPEAITTLKLLRQGGPFPHAKDGTVFGNRERMLPRRPRGYYTEYTVHTPGRRDRGARRIVAGGQPPKFVEYYYTDDHYATFKRIQPEIGPKP